MRANDGNSEPRKIEHRDQQIQRGQGGETHQVANGRPSGFVELDGGAGNAADFVAQCRQLRFWERERTMAPAV